MGPVVYPSEPQSGSTAPSLSTGGSTTIAMNPLSTVYATKRRRRNGKSIKQPAKDVVTKTNPSKRHRERLNAELDTLANLLPFESNILSKLDRLSILRLSVSYLRTKSYFQVTMHNSKEESSIPYRTRSELGTFEHLPTDGDMFLQALNGFLVILTCEGEVFFATHTIESYLGFHQSDIVHQSVYELVHSEDREELQRQLMWNSFLPADQSNITLQEAVAPENSHLLERSFTVRFRCLLDNTSGFLRLDIRGRVKIIYGQNRKTEEPPLGLFAICTPFGPPSLLEIPHKEVMFKSKHKLDLSLVSMDQRGKILLGYADSELANMGGYDLVHYDDLAYVASAHQELLKTGASGMIAYRYQTKDGQWQWLQTSSRLVYKNSKPDFVICTHRPLMEEEGRDLIGKRTMDFKVSYLDAGLTNSYFSDSADQLLSSSSSTNPYSPTTAGSSSATVASSSASTTSKSTAAGGGGGTSTSQRVNRRYKTQLRDFLSTCRTKRKLSNHHGHHHGHHHHHAASHPASAIIHHPASTIIHHPTPTTPSSSAVDYIANTTDPTAAAAVAVAYSNLNSMYSVAPPYSANPESTLSPYMSSSSSHPAGPGAATAGNFHQAIYDNRIPYHLTAAATDNLFHQYRPLGNYYPEYHHHHSPPTTPYNGFLEISSRNSPSSLPTYDVVTSPVVMPPVMQEHHHHKPNDCNNRLYHQQLLDHQKYLDNNAATALYHHLPPQPPPSQSTVMSSNLVYDKPPSIVEITATSTKLDDDVKTEVFQHYSTAAATLTADPPRQTVLMWALNHTPQPSSISGGSSCSNGRSPTEETAGGSDTPPVIINGSMTTITAASNGSSNSGGKKSSSYTSTTVTAISGDPLKSLAEMNSMQVATTNNNNKWKPDTPPSPKAYYHHASQYGHDESGPPPHPSEHSSCFNSTNGSRMLLSVVPDKPDRSPLLSISEVTNTLLNQ